MLDRVNNSTPSLDASRLFENAYSHLKPGIKFVQERPVESIAAGVVLVSAAALALRGRGLSALGTAGEEALGKNVLGNFLRGKSAAGEKLVGSVARQLDSAALKPGAEHVQYRTVAEEVAAFSRNLDRDAAYNRHDTFAHVLTLRNPATPGGELRGAISESVAEQMIMRPRRQPSFEVALSNYELSRTILINGYDCKPPKIPTETLEKWFNLSQRRMAENIERWGGVPRSFWPGNIWYRDLKHLAVPQKWS